MFQNQSILGKLIIRTCLIVFFCILLCPGGAKAQSGLKPMNNGLPGQVFLAASEGDIIYALVDSSEWQWGDQPNAIYKWDGIKWKKDGEFDGYLQLTPYIWPQTQMFIYKGKPYLQSVRMRIDTAFYDFVAWDGKEWQPTALGKSSVYTSTIHQNKLIVHGSFDKIGNMDANGLASFDGSNWSAVGPSASRQGCEGTTYDMVSIDSVLFLFGSELSAPNDTSQTTGNNLYWNGKEWKNFDDTTFSYYPFVFKNELYSLTGTYYKPIVKKWDNGIWMDATNGLDLIAPGDFTGWNFKFGVEANGKFWMTYVDSNFHSRVFNYNGTTWKDLGIKTETEWDEFSQIVKAGENVYVLGRISYYKGVNLKNAAMVSEQFGMISGLVYNDENENCTRDGNEKTVSEQLLEITPGSYIISTNKDGKFSTTLDTGTFTIRCLPKRNWDPACPSGNNSKIFKVTAGNETSNLNFGNKLKSNLTDLRVLVIGKLGFRARAGFFENYVLEYENTGSAKVTGKIVLDFSSQASKFTSDPNPTSQSSGNVSWNFKDLQPQEKKQVNFTVRIDSAAKINDTVSFIVRTDITDLTDNYPSDNSDTLQQVIRASLDPNDKQSWPSGKIVPETKEVKYVIRFQNEGTDTAYRVVVMDTLDFRLPITKLQLTKASHPYKIDIRENIIRWTFDNILLPPKSQDEAMSQGFISFTTALKPGLSIGTQINNRAHIFFDYQNPVITNYAQFRIGMDVDSTNTSTVPEYSIKTQSLSLYPNPAANEVHISNTSTQRQTIFLFDATGRMIDTIQLLAGEVKSLNTSDWRNGLYLIRTSSGESGKVVIQH